MCIFFFFFYSTDDESSSNLNTDPNNVDNTANFEFIYKYK